jgi:hypothetical protein
MKTFFNRYFKNKKKLEGQLHNKEMIFFYKQLLKMKKNRPHLNAFYILKKCYPALKNCSNKCIAEYENTITSNH